jgi:hypothetical protein
MRLWNLLMFSHALKLQGRRKIHSDPIDRLGIAMKEYEWERAFSNAFIDETMR